MLTGSNYQVFVVVNGVTRAVDQNGALVSGGGYQFANPQDAVAALSTAIANENGAMTSFRCVQTPA